ncbi:uncharacterized protein PV07_01544 [Cladophialophora immunda]|uniref:Metallo-beta-lactamase domain-containing protein n=1 Tax=Cladophialophora immunda TaxID=569365 RepID=A0A0D2CUG5_9EURO|nr:uncharacterized protein PV07_01544 [Cladophialophora immunda]KIW34788.1 hypothetical protein PV07_01544 [Cladophialophora immunda]
MSDETSESFHVPISCPFTIEQIQTSGLTNSKTYLIREHDRYGEFPHIYAKICGTPSSATPSRNTSPRHGKTCRVPGVATQDGWEGHQVIVLSDTGCGTEVPSSSSHPSPPARGKDVQDHSYMRAEPEVWNIGTFLEYTINPGGRIAYLVMTTHCHYDHIMGIGKLPPTSTEHEESRDQVQGNFLSDGSAARPATTVLSSSYGKSFITPYSNLQNHSLCDKLDLQAPRYDVGIWAKDVSRVVYTHPTTSSSFSTETSPRPLPASIATPLTILHTPGHTPDSLSWYDSDLRLLCVGDSFYVKETPATRNAKWGPEPPMPVIFDLESDLGQWWRSLKKVLDFVRERNAESEEEEGLEDERLRMGTEADGEADADAEGDEGFVYIDPNEAASVPSTSGVDVDSKRRAQPALQSQSVAALPEQAKAKAAPKRIVTGKQETPRAQAQQTGFDIPSPSKRGVIALPILATPRGRLPTDPDQADDVWMMVVDPVARPRPQRTPDHPVRPRLDPVITPRRVHPGPPTSFRRDRNLLAPPLHCPPIQAQIQPEGHAGRRRRPRVRLCAAHTTLSVDAERAILSIQRFMARILENDVPCRRAEDGPRGEERWIWDDALSSSLAYAAAQSDTGGTVKHQRDASVRGVVRDLERADPGHAHGQRHGIELDGNAPSAPNTGRSRHSCSYSVLAPLSVIKQGRRSILGRPAGVV